MFWDDIREIKQTLNSIRLSMDYEMSRPNIDMNKTRKLEGVITEEHEEEISHLENVEHSLEVIKELIEDTSNNDHLENSFDRIHDKLNMLLSDEKRNHAVELADKTLDKFEDYMKNVDKLNMMVNEFKGLVSVTRACLSDKKELETLLQDIRVVADRDRYIGDEIKKNTEISLSLHSQQFKIDAIYKVLIEDNQLAKKPLREVKKRVKKVKE